MYGDNRAVIWADEDTMHGKLWMMCRSDLGGTLVISRGMRTASEDEIADMLTDVWRASDEQCASALSR